MTALGRTGQLNFELRTRHAQDAFVIELSGELDLASVGQFNDLKSLIAASESNRVVVDMRRLQFIDSTGIHALIMLDRTTNEQQRSMVLVCGESPVARAFETARLDTVLDFADAESAIPG